MFFKEWIVLLVDDERDVLSMSKLMMKNIEVYGLPLKIYTADSKEAAISLLNTHLELANSLAVAFIDVVMETDSAGLDLCAYIREDMDNRLSQLYIRTGQPGVSTETAVIDRYDINGYFTKIEVTKSKLYSLIKSSVRQYLSFGMSLTTVEILKDLVCSTPQTSLYFPPGDSQALSEPQKTILGAVHQLGGYSLALEDVPRWLFLDGKIQFAEETDQDRGYSVRDSLLPLQGVPLDPAGDRYVSNEECFHLLQVSEKETQAEAVFVFQTRFQPPEHIIDLLYSVITALASAWKQADAE